MEDDKLKDIFQSFQPELTSDTLFMSKLKSGMDSVEIVKRYAAAQNRRNRIAVMVAAFTGVFMGIIIMLLLPHIVNLISSFSISFSSIGIKGFNIDWRMACWMVSGAVCVFTSLNAYEITLSKLSTKDS